MKRFAFSQLQSWKKKEIRKPLIIRGARQVGKTWLMKSFGKAEFASVLYVNFEEQKQLQKLFINDYNISRILLALQVESGVQPVANETLIILDEIQEAEGGITSLKYFNENAPEYHIIAAGSYLGISMHKKASFPVGKVEFLDLYPMSFEEYILAMNENALADLLEKRDWPLISTFKNKYIDLLKQYYFVGGMPEAVKSFVKNKNFHSVRKIQINLLKAYANDFSKHAPTAIVLRIKMVWNSIPAQLSKENRKFIFGLIKKGSRAKEYELAFEWLIDSGLIHKVNRISKPAMPLSAYKDIGAFKVFMLDVGLLGAMAKLDVKSLILGNAIFEEFKGSLTEQYVYQQLKENQDLDICYWSQETSKGEIDFVIQKLNTVIPTEVKAAENLQAKSLKAFNKKYQPKLSVRTSLSDYREEDWLTNVPLYSISNYFK